MGVYYLSLEEVIYAHNRIITESGGSHGIRDLSLLESAVRRPKASFAGEDLYPTLFEKAAALIHSLILNHPFLDGNKRTGVFAAIEFLQRNGYRIKISRRQFENLALSVEARKLNLDQIASWLKKHSVRLK